MPSFIESASNTLALTQSATQTVVRLLSADTALNSTQTVTSNLKPEAVANTLVLADLLTSNNIQSEAANNLLSFLQTLSSTSALPVAPTDVLLLTQLAESSIKHGIAANTLTILQSVDVQGPISITAFTNITAPIDEVDLDDVPVTDNAALQVALDAVGLQDAVIVQLVNTQSVTSFLSFSQQAAKTTILTASNHVQLSQLAESVLHEDVLSALSLTQSVTVDSVDFGTSVLDLSQIATATGINVRSLTDTVTLANIVTFYRINTLCTYDPGVGAGPPAPSMVDPVLTRRSTVIFTYPYVNPTSTIEVRNPQFDDLRQIEFRKINRKTRGGTLKVFRDSNWPSSERLIWSFDNLKEAKKKDMLDFFELTTGQEIGILDFQSRQWRGIILTPMTQVGNEDRPGNTLTLEFEGTIDPGGLSVNINNTANIFTDMTDIPPGFQVNISATALATANVLRD